MEYSVYSITTINDGIKYFGRSQEIEKRWRSHINMLRTNTHANTRMQSNFNEFGESNFKFDVLNVFDSLAEAIASEQRYINDNTVSNYNIADSTIGGDTFTRNPRREEIREKHRLNGTGERNPMFGRPKSERMLSAVIEANSKPIMVDGVVYDSTSQYARKIGVGPNTVSYRVGSVGFPNYQRVERINA